jgi:hypothetical protein
LKIKEILTERVKARIDHPEDFVWREGSVGYTNAIKAIDFAQRNPENIKIKFDGTTCLIVGRDDNGVLVLTDKSGFGATKYDGHAKSQQDVYQMLYNRSPDQEGREQFAKAISSLYPLFDLSIDKDIRGYYQGDLLYVGKPDIVDNFYVFKPNKIEYRVPVDSILGKKIANSKAGIVFHGFFKDRGISVPEPINDISKLSLDKRLFVLNSQMGNISLNISKPNRIENINLIDDLLNKEKLRNNKISDFPLLIGKFLGYMARTGSIDYNNAAQNFITWVETYSNLSISKQERIKNYIAQHMKSYMVLWSSIKNIVEFKSNVKSNIDSYDTTNIQAYLNGEKSHEGYVVNTPYAVIKLVDRHKFMREKE